MTHVRNFSYSHDKDHVHVHSHAILLHWKIASISIHHKIKLQIIPWLSLSKVTIKDMGYTKRNKRCIPKEGMPHAHKACQKEKEKKKRCIPKEGMPHARKACQIKKYNSLPPQININSYQSQSLSFMQNLMLMQLVYCLELCQILWPMLETFHTPMIKITYTSTHMLYFYTGR